MSTDGPVAADEGPRTAVLFTTHRLCPAVAGRYFALRREKPSSYDLFLALDLSAADEVEVERARELAGDRLFGFRPSAVTDVDYPRPWALEDRKGLVPGNLDLLHLHFARRHDALDRLWIVEYDVCYTGDWGSLFGRFEQSRADVLGTTLRGFSACPGWHWWPSFRPSSKIPPREWLRGFFPILRVSRRALDAVDAAYREGWSGHFEAVLPTVARSAGLEIEDIGGDGPFVEPDNRNRHYVNSPEREHLSPGTFAYRPARRFPGLRRDKLWHPVKPTAGRLSSFVNLSAAWFRAKLG